MFMRLFHVFFVLLFEMPNRTLTSFVGGHDYAIFNEDDEPGEFSGDLPAHCTRNVLFSDDYHVHALLLVSGSDSDR